jgi:hypothetical protein
MIEQAALTVAVALASPLVGVIAVMLVIRAIDAITSLFNPGRREARHNLET